MATAAEIEALIEAVEVAAMALVDTVDREGDPLLWEWAASVEMAAREYKAVPVLDPEPNEEQETKEI